MADSIQVRVQAQIDNYQQIVDTIKEGIEKGLVDGVSDEALNKLTNRLKTMQGQLNADDLEAAIKTMQSFGTALLRVTEAINVAAGGASSELAELTDKLNKAKSALAELEKRNPADKYREKGGAVLKRKTGLDRTLIGVSSDEDFRHGRATFTDAKGGAQTVYYGGADDSKNINWSVTSAIRNLLKAINNGTVVAGKEVEKAFKEFGVQLVKGADGIYSTKPLDLAKQRASELEEYRKQHEAAEAAVASAELEIKEAEVNAEHLTIESEEGKFTDPTSDVTAANKNSSRIADDFNKAQKKATKEAQKESDAAEDLRDKQDKLAESTRDATAAQNNQNGAISKAVTTFFGYQMALRQLRKLWREAIRTITELDKQLTNQAIVTNLTREEAWQLVTTYQQLADQAGVTQTEIASVTTEYLRQGETIQNALTLTKAATAAATVAGISASDSVKYLTTAIHGFKLEAEDALAVSDKFAALAAQAATNYEDLAVALSKVASQAELAGMSMDYTLALLTTGLDITQEAPESIGTALKTVIARMREISDYGKTLDDEMSLNQVEAGLKAVGIELRSGTGELRSTEAVLDELGRKWTELSANQQAAVAKALAGTRQQSRLVAIMENYDDVIKNMNVANNSLGATTAQQVKYLQGMEAAMNRLQNAYQSLIESFVKSDFIIGIVNTIAGLLQKVQKFLNNPAGRAALITGVISFLLKSKELVEKLKGFLSQILTIVTNTRKEEERITAEKRKQIDTVSKDVYNRAGVTDEALARGGVGKAERPNGWFSNRADTASFADVLKLYLSPQYWGKQHQQERQDTFKSWRENNSIVAKISERRQQKKNDQQVIDDNVEKNERLIELEQQLAKSRAENGDATTALKAAEDELNRALEGDEYGNQDPMQIYEAETKLDAARTKEAEEQRAIEDEISKLRESGLQDTKESQKTLKVLNSKLLTREQKIEYLKNKEWLSSKKVELAEIDRKKAAGEELTAEEKKLDAARKGAEAEIKKTEDNSTTSLGGKLSQGASAAAGIASAAAGFISMFQGMVDTIQNRYKEIVDNAIDKGNEIQSKIYENTQTMTHLQNLSDDLHKLDRQVVKTADSMKQLEDVRTQLLTELELTEAETRLYTNQQLYDKAMAKRAQLEEENQKLLGELGDTLLGAANNYDAAAGAMNILQKTAMGAGLGATLASALNVIPAFGQVAYSVTVALSTAIGAIVGVVEEISKKMAAEDAKGKVHELLQTDEGVGQMRYYFQAMYKNTVDTSTRAGQELANSVKTTYASLMESLSGKDMEKLLDKYNWNTQNMADSVANAFAENGDALKKLTGDSANYQERVQAAGGIYAALAAESEVLGNAFLEQYGAYIQLGVLLGDSVKVMDQFKWSMTDMNELLTQLAEDGWSAAQMSEAVAKLGAAMEDGTLSSEELAGAMGNMSDEAVKAAQKLIANGQDMQSLADQSTYAKNQVTNIRDTQSKWNSMSASDRQRFITENEDFFNQEGAYEAFINGEDTTKFVEAYKEELQSGLLKTTSDLIMATETELYRLEREYREETDEDKRKQLEKQIASAKRELKELKATYEDVNSIFELSLSEVIKKQNEQIAKLKEMYQAEEKALTESLQKRKEAYQDYFNSLKEAERIEEYAESRDQLLSSISRLSGGTDATSRNKMRDLQKQLKELEKQEAQQRKEDARQAVLDNIDDQISDIQEKFDKLLNNNQELLASMDANTEMEYLAYLSTTGKTEEELELIKQEMSDLLRGRWESSGRQDFDIPTASVPVVDVEPGVTENSFNVIGANGEVHSVELSAQQMQQLITQMLQQINKWTGSTYAINKR